jgi:ATP-dependent RNA helicase SUPV3L1/SUV3
MVFQLGEALGSLPALAVAPLRPALAASDRQALARLGVRFGTETIYFDGLLKPKAAALRGLLWAVQKGGAVPPAPAEPGAPRDPAIADSAYAAMGYRVLGRRVLRVDRVERLAAAARKLARQGPFAASPELAALAHADVAELALMLPSLGYRAVLDTEGGAVTFHTRDRRSAKPRARRPRGKPADSPFAKLRELRLAR